MTSTAEPINEVHIVGQVQAAPEVRSLPSGDQLVVVRVAVGRPDSARRSTRSPRHDLFEVNCFSAGTRRSALTLVEGQTVEVEGAMRRRIWRSAAGISSRMELEAARLRTGRARRKARQTE